MGLLEKGTPKKQSGTPRKTLSPMSLYTVPYTITVTFADGHQETRIISERITVEARDSDDATACVDRIWDEGDSLFPDEFVENVLYEEPISCTDLDIGTPELVETHGN